MQSIMDSAVAGKTFKYEIGKKRADGKYNVWTLKHVRPGIQPDWVIVYVGNTWPAAKRWIDAHGQKEAA